MKILSLTAGAAGMYCGSCLRDNALAVELLSRGHDVTLVPLYTPTATDIVNLPNSLLIGLAGPLHKALRRPICCTLQGEDLFLEGLTERYRDRVLALIQQRVADVDMFTAVSDYYAPMMSRLLKIPAERMAVVPLGINLAGYDQRAPGSGACRSGY